VRVLILICSTCLILSCKQPHGDSTFIESQQEIDFPHDWEGKWYGTLVISKLNGDTTQVPMQLHILPQDSSWYWDYVIVYGNSKTGTRNYELLPVEGSKGHYRIDEKNSIILDAYYIGNTLYSRFSVEKSLISTRTALTGNKLHYEILSGRKNSISTTGGKDDIPEVNSYEFVVQQKAVLERR